MRFSKTQRALDAQRKRNEEMGIKSVRDAEEPIELEKGDFRSMFFSAMITLFLPASGALLLIGLFAYLLIKLMGG